MIIASAMWLFSLTIIGDGVSPAAELDKLREQIARDMQSVERKLRESDAGDGTRNLQSQILSNLDKLLKRLKNPPPQSSESQPMGGSSPMSQSSSSKPQPGGTQHQQQTQSMSRRERREAQRREQQRERTGRQPMGRPEQNQSITAKDPMADGNSMPTSREPARSGPPETIADVVKDIWGHLPETLRQEVDQYYREKFMPRYRDLLQQYYLRLAETERRPGDRKP